MTIRDDHHVSPLAMRVLMVAAAAVALVGLAATREVAAQPAPVPAGGSHTLDGPGRIAYTVAKATTLSVPVRLRRSEFLRLDVHADGVDVRARVYAKAGQLIAESGPLRGTAMESVVIIGGAAGPGTVQLRAAPTRRSPGRLEIAVAERRPVEPPDAVRASAQRAYAAGWALLDAPHANVNAARERFDTAKRLWIETMDARMEARAWNALGEAHDRAGDYKQALAAAERRRSLASESGDVPGELWALNEVARQQLQLSREEASRDTLLALLPRWRTAGDRRGEAAAQVLLGIYYVSAGDKEQAGLQLTQALGYLEDAGDAEWHATALQQLGNYHNTFGERQRALDDFSEAVRMLDRVRDRRIEAGIRHDFGTLYNMLGEYELARGEYARSVSLFRQAGDVVPEAHALMNIGTNYADLNEPVRAERYLAQARPLFHRLGDTRTEATVLNNLSTIQRDLGRSAESLASVEAAHRAFVEAGMVRGEMISLTGMGYLLCQFRRFEEGRGRLKEAVRLAQNATDRAQEALALSFTAGCEADAGDLDAAHAHVNEAHALVERLRTEILRDDLRSSFFSTTRPILERKADILMRLAARDPDGPWKAAAFEISEQARARSLLELVPALRTSADARVPAALAAARDALVAKLRKPDGDATAAGDLLAEYYELRSRIRAEDPRYAELTDPATLSLKEAQASIAPGTVVLEYLLGRTRGDLWAITDREVVHADLPARRDIERIVRRMRQSLRSRETDSDPARLRASDERYWRDAAALSRIVLTPIARMLNSGKIYVVPDGVLHLVPFAALPLPGRPSAGRPTPLVVAADVVSIPSLSVLASARAAAQTRSAADERIAVIADPVYEAGDPRLAPVASASASSPLTVRRSSGPRTVSASRSEPRDFRRLAGSTVEAAAIVRAAAGRGSVSTFEGFAASRTAVAGSRLQPFRVVHFATHGLLDSRQPERSGLVLSLYDRQGRPTDGYLRLLDVYEMALSADLVVLSGCETALGREMEGEGVIGLTRGFLVAGAAHVVSSQWKIPDSGATPRFMAWFYDALLRRAMSPASALRYAQTRMWASGQWSAPYFWAAFTLHGD